MRFRLRTVSIVMTLCCVLLGIASQLGTDVAAFASSAG
jgi:hypothetical protein